MLYAFTIKACSDFLYTFIETFLRLIETFLRLIETFLRLIETFLRFNPQAQMKHFCGLIHRK